MNIQKKFMFFLYHSIVFLLALFILKIGYRIFAGQAMVWLRAETFLLALFSLLYYGLMWYDLYRKPYSFYLRYTLKVAVKNLVLALAGTFVVALPVFFIFPSLGLQNDRLLLFLMAETAIFLVLHIIHYLWIMNLARLGLFHKKILYLGMPDDRFPLELLLRDSGGTKEYGGTGLFKNGVWTYQDPDNKASKYSDLDGLFFRNQISEAIIFLGRDMHGPEVARVTEFCRTNAISYYLVPDIKALPRLNRWSQSLPYIPLIEQYATRRDSITRISIKRLVDIVFSSLVLLAFLPFWLIIALAIKLEDRGPVLYLSTRIGKNGLPIKFYKFRSMVPNAEALKAQLLTKNERKDGPLFKMKDDPRITKVGKILRKFSLDEMPQFLNVLKGDMSVVGPRPHLPSEVSCYVNQDYLRLECIPGITCIPQVTDRNNLSFREWVDLDIKYRKEWSLMMDFVLMLKTAKVVLQPLFKRDGHGY